MQYGRMEPNMVALTFGLRKFWYNRYESTLPSFLHVPYQGRCYAEPENLLPNRIRCLKS